MQFTVDNAVYRINFRYDEQMRKNSGSSPSIQDITIASIKEPGDQGQVVATAQVIRFHKDGYDRDVARKAALRKALAPMDRAFRKTAWDAYHTRPGGIRYVKP